MSEISPSVSVIIVNYNGIDFVAKCLQSLRSTDYPKLETIVVDNASTDGSYAFLADQLSGKGDFRVIRNATNVGFAAANNIGYRESTGDVLVFLNVDVIVDRAWLRRLVTALCSSETLAAAQPRLLSEKGDALDSLGGFLDRMGYVYLYGQWYFGRPSTSSGEPFYVEGAALAVKRVALGEVLLNGEPFDSDYFYFYEDTDLCWRLRLRGFRVACVSDATVYHHRGYATSRDRPQATYLFLRNRISTLVKNYGLLNLTIWLPTLMLFELLHATISLVNRPLNGIAKLWAIAWSIKNLKCLIVKRAQVQSRIRRVDDSSITRLMIPPNMHTLMRSLVHPS
jgi:GT2 family glycosyltransferase